MTDEELRELERLEKEATPGPWQAYALNDDWDDAGGPSWIGITSDKTTIVESDGMGGLVGKANAIFITAARNALPSLLSEVRLLRERLGEAEGLLRVLSSSNHYECPWCFTAPNDDGTRDHEDHCETHKARAFLAGSHGEPCTHASVEHDAGSVWCRHCGKKVGPTYDGSPGEGR